MSIPKVIHYCWFGENPQPESVQHCIQSWKKFCPDYEIIEWNESNFDCSTNRYCREAYEQKKWAFVSDYARLKIINDQGGIYLDTDVELVKPLDDLLEYGAFMGFERAKPSASIPRFQVATGLGFGAIPRHPVIQALLADYADIPFVLPDGTCDCTACPDRSTNTLVSLGLVPDDSLQMLGDVCILPAEYLCPQDFYSGKLTMTEHTYSIHHYDASWISSGARRSIALRHLVGNRVYRILYRVLLHHFSGWEC